MTVWEQIQAQPEEVLMEKSGATLCPVIQAPVVEMVSAS